MRIIIIAAAAVLCSVGIAQAEEMSPAWSKAYKACVGQVKKAQPDVNWGTTFFFVEQCMRGKGEESMERPRPSAVVAR